MAGDPVERDDPEAASFEELTQRQLRIARGEEPWGEGTSFEQSRRFRLEVVVPKLVDHTRKNSRGLIGAGRIDLLLSLSGLSPETTVLSCLVLRPRRVVVISSGNAVKCFELIRQILVHKGTWCDKTLELAECDPDDPTSIAKLVARVSSGSNQSESVTIDITGGKKIMTAAAALAAWKGDLPMTYVDGCFDPELRQPKPGSERSVTIDRPSSLFAREFENETEVS